MKKFVALALSFLLLVTCSTVSIAEAIDFSGYSLDELLEIRANLAEEIASRPGGEKQVIGAGQYIIGESIPAGIYTFKFVQNGKNDVSRTGYYIYENESMFRYDIDRSWLGDMPKVESSLRGDGETILSLYPGELLYLQYNGAEISRVGNVPERTSDYTVPEGTAIPAGEYTIGVEIPAGTYKIYYNGGGFSSRVRIFQDANEASGTFNSGKESIINETNTEKLVTLVDGNVIRVEYSSVIMAKSSGFSFD